ncbi:MAG: hypothetical protein B6U97_04810 [Candidatus Altiarchaeales archaeon ex4484_96]|nr:MAG: hypothetical protein B6U97_04810 [Candidatus Altiarchaeales archaeon ex4484_96]
MIKLLPYKAVQCPFCGRKQVTQAVKRFSCRLCGKSTSFRHKGKWNVKLKDFSSEKQAREYCQIWSGEELIEGGFSSAKEL